MINKIVKLILILMLLGTVIFAGIFIYAYKSTNKDLEKIIKYTPNISTEILDRNGNRLAYIFKKRHRLYATYNEIPIYVVEGLIAMEDTKFFEHNGVNPDAIVRAIVKDIKAGHMVEGGSTITQQLIKNTMLSNKKKLERKLKEAILAIKIEQKLSKEQILERYLNEIAYGNNYLGIKTAAEGYFRKPLSQLTLKESAILVGIPNAPSYYNPLRHYERSIKRANIILFRLKSLGWISDSEYKKAKEERPKVYKTTLSQNVAPYIIDEVRRRMRKKFKDLDVGGYKIYTTIDSKKQKIAKDGVKYGLKKVLKLINENINKTNLNGAVVIVENKTGDILALVGGADYKKSSFNRATMTKRQPGSAFKPFVYQSALDLGYNPATKLTDLSRTFTYKENGKVYKWTPKNYERDFKGFISLREALVESRNLATVNLVYDIGLDKIISRLRMLDVDNIPNNLSISLGNLALSPMKMAQIYTVFSNSGHMIEPRLISKIVSKHNSVIYETKPKEIADFTKPEQAYLMTSILQDVVKKGTGRNAKVKGIELAGKTGTTNRYIDAWFCGYSPTLTTIVWFGRDKYKPIGKSMTGGRVSAPVFSYIYSHILKEEPNIKRYFDIPVGAKLGDMNGTKEYYTNISPLPKSGDSKDEFGFDQPLPNGDSNSSDVENNDVDTSEKIETIKNSTHKSSDNFSNTDDVEVLF